MNPTSASQHSLSNPVASASIQPIGCMEREAHSLTVVVKLIRKEKRVGLECGIGSVNGSSL
jgi:hypothetical protein